MNMSRLRSPRIACTQTILATWRGWLYPPLLDALTAGEPHSVGFPSQSLASLSKAVLSLVPDQEHHEPIRRHSGRNPPILDRDGFSWRHRACLLQSGDLLCAQVLWSPHLVKQCKAVSVRAVHSVKSGCVHYSEMVQLYDEGAWRTRQCGVRSVSWPAATGWRVIPFRNCQASIRKFRGENGIGINRDAAVSKLMQNGQGIQ